MAVPRRYPEVVESIGCQRSYRVRKFPPMIANPLALRLDPALPIREQIFDAAKLGARGVVLDATGDLSPHRLSDTGRRELKHLLRTVELKLAALNLPTRRSFDTADQLDERIRRADAAFALAFELGTNLVLARVGAIPPEDEPERRKIFDAAVQDLSARADHRGVRLTIETGADPLPNLESFLSGFDTQGIAVSIDPASLASSGVDPSDAVRALAPWVAHAYANDAADLAASAKTIIQSRVRGLPSGAIDWEEYVGAFEEIGYRGFLTIWPGTGRDAPKRFKQVKERFDQIG